MINAERDRATFAACYYEVRRAGSLNHSLDSLGVNADKVRMLHVYEGNPVELPLKVPGQRLLQETSSCLGLDRHLTLQMLE